MLLQAYAEIKAEVEALRAPPRGAEPGAWDAVGSKHDAGDRDLAAGDWKEAVLINADPKLAREVRRRSRARMRRLLRPASLRAWLAGGAHPPPLSCHVPRARRLGGGGPRGRVWYRRMHLLGARPKGVSIVDRAPIDIPWLADGTLTA